jgi:hypothetical protein
MNPYKPPATPVADSPAPDGKLTPATCTHCGHQFDAVARKSFLGFQKFTCEQCRKEFTSALFRGYRITYWVLLVLAAVLMITSSNVRPNIFFVLMAIAVTIDAYRLWKGSR